MNYLVHCHKLCDGATECSKTRPNYGVIHLRLTGSSCVQLRLHGNDSDHDENAMDVRHRMRDEGS